MSGSANSPENRRAPAREAILGAHQFPGEYTIKAFGRAGDAFRVDVLEFAHAVVDPARVTVSERSTRSGDRVCVTLTVHAERVEEVEELYVRLYTVPDILLIF